MDYQMQRTRIYTTLPTHQKAQCKRNEEGRSLRGAQFHETVTISHQHAGQTSMRVMHGLERRMPLFIEPDEFHRSRVIDPNLSDKGVSTPRETALE